MSGKVSGLPTAVPIAAASKLPPIRKAIANPMKKWKPMNGVNEANAPAATPAAIACGEPESLITRLAR